MFQPSDSQGLGEFLDVPQRDLWQEPEETSEHVWKRTALLEDLLVGLDDGAEAVEHQGAQLSTTALRSLVVVQRAGGQDEPALLQLQGRALGARFHLFVEPA